MSNVASGQSNSASNVIVRLKRRNRYLMMITGVLALLAGYGLIRAPASSGAQPMDADDLEDLRQQLISASFSERIHLLHRLKDSGGSEAEETLIEMLRQANTDRVRLKAISQLRRIGSDRVVGALTEFVPSARRPIQRKIIAALGQIGSEAAVTSLLSLLEERDTSLEKRLRGAVVLALGEAGGSRAESTLIHLAQQTGEPARLDAISALATVGTQKAIGVLATLARHRSPSLHLGAINALGQAGTDQARDVLHRLVQQGSRQIQSQAIRALAGYSDDVTQELLISMCSSPDRTVAHAALSALGQQDGLLARQALLEAAQSGDMQTRAVAANALTHSGSPEARDLLIHELRSSPNPYQAARALVTMDDPLARQALLQMAQDGSQNAQRAVIWALGSLQEGGPDDQQQVDQVLSELVANASPRVASAALDQVARRQGKTALPLLIQSFREGSGEMQATALRALATIDDPASKKLIMEAVSSGIPNLTHQGIQALVTMDGPAATDTLIGLLQQGDPRSQASAAHALAQVGGPRARAALLEAFKEDKVPGGITYALGQMADAQTTDQLTQLINDPSVSTNTKEQAIQALSYGSSPDALLKVAAHSDDAIAARAMQRLGSMGGPDAEMLLLDALSSAQGPKQQAALTSLASMGTPKAVEAIGQTLHNPELKEGAFGALANIGTKKAMDALTGYYRSAGSSDRATIVRQLAYNQSPRARRLLEQALDDSSETVAAHAAGALARLGGNKVSGRLVTLLQSGPSKAVRYAIASALRWSNSTLYRQHKELIMRVYSEGT